MSIGQGHSLRLVIKYSLQSIDSVHFEKERMNKSKSPPLKASSKLKSATSKTIESRIRAQLAPLFKPARPPPVHFNNSQRKPYGLLLKSTRYSSPNSCQSSSLISKNHSRERLRVFKQMNQCKEGGMRKKRKIVPQKSYGHIKFNESLKRVVHLDHKVSRPRQTPDFREQWKKNIIERFVVEGQACPKCRTNQLSTLEESLKAHLQEDKSHSASFLKFALSEGVNESGLQSCMTGPTRTLTIDWMYLISASLLLNRETVHLAVHYMDSYFSCCGGLTDHIHTVAAACLYLSVKQEERDSQAALIETVCLSQKIQMQRAQIIEMEHNILMKLNFKLKSNTLAFWVDYFTLKWDTFVDSQRGIEAQREIGLATRVVLRSADGQCYRLYREIVQLADCCLLFGEHIKFTQAKLGLACIYLVLRVEIERQQKRAFCDKENHQIDNRRHRRRHEPQPEKPAEEEDLFKFYHKEFMKKASPIFKDPFRINELFNGFLTELCEFEITEIIPGIKYVSQLLDLEMSYNIDNKALEETGSYEDFLRRMTYSISMKDYAMRKEF